MKSLKKNMLLGLVALAATPPLYATTVDFTYTGGPDGCTSCTTIGDGSFSFTGTPLSIGINDLTAFSLVDHFSETGYSADYSYGLGDLGSFSATFDAAGDVTALSLQTDLSSGYQYLEVYSLGSAYTLDEYLGDTEYLTTGTVSTTTVGTAPVGTVPEPGTYALVLAALSAAGVAGRKRRA